MESWMIPTKPMFLNCRNFCPVNNVFFKQWYFVISRTLGEGTLQFNYRMHVMHFMATLFWFFVIPMGDTIFDLIWFSFNPLIVLLLFFSFLLGRTHNIFACAWKYYQVRISLHHDPHFCGQVKTIWIWTLNSFHRMPQLKL